jgi:hypothetical protein
MSGDGIFLTMTTVMAGSCVAMISAMMGFLRAKRDLEPSRMKDDDLRPALMELRKEIEALGVHVERVAESQRFLAQLQIERAEALRQLQAEGARG